MHGILEQGRSNSRTPVEPFPCTEVGKGQVGVRCRPRPPPAVPVFLLHSKPSVTVPSKWFVSLKCSPVPSLQKPGTQGSHLPSFSHHPTPLLPHCSSLIPKRMWFSLVSLVLGKTFSCSVFLPLVMKIVTFALLCVSASLNPSDGPLGPSGSGPGLFISRSEAWAHVLCAMRGESIRLHSYP